MPSAKSNPRRQAKRMALCSMMAALSVALMLLGGLIPVALYAVPMLAGLCLVPVLMEFGIPSAWMTYLAVSLLTLILGFDKEAAFFYIFLGYYPIVKPCFDRVKRRPLRVLAKLALFVLAISAMYAFIGFVLGMREALADFETMGRFMLIAFIALFGLCYLIYDRLLLVAAYIYVKRLRPRLKFL